MRPQRRSAVPSAPELSGLQPEGLPGPRGSWQVGPVGWAVPEVTLVPADVTYHTSRQRPEGARKRCRADGIGAAGRPRPAGPRAARPLCVTAAAGGRRAPGRGGEGEAEAQPGYKPVTAPRWPVSAPSVGARHVAGPGIRMGVLPNGPAERWGRGSDQRGLPPGICVPPATPPAPECGRVSPCPGESGVGREHTAGTTGAQQPSHRPRVLQAFWVQSQPVSPGPVSSQAGREGGTPEPLCWGSPVVLTGQAVGRQTLLWEAGVLRLVRVVSLALPDPLAPSAASPFSSSPLGSFLSREPLGSDRLPRWLCFSCALNPVVAAVTASSPPLQCLGERGAGVRASPAGARLQEDAAAPCAHSRACGA